MRTVHRNIVGGFIISKDGKILLGKNRKGGVYEGDYVVPGGGIDEGETKEIALQREMLEETGIDITHAVLTPMQVDAGEHEKTLRDTGELALVKMVFYNFCIYVDNTAVNIAVVADDDWGEPRWFDFQEVVGINLSAPTKRGIIRLTAAKY